MSILPQHNISDIYFVTLAHYNNVLAKTIQEDPLASQNIALFRLDNVAGTHASRPLSNLRADRAFADAAMLFSFCQNEKLIELGKLCNLLCDLNSILPGTELINGYEDIVVSLSHSHLAKIIAHSGEQRLAQIDALASMMVDLKTESEEYGYLVNVIAYNILMTWSLCGEANSDTQVDKGLGLTTINVLIVPETSSESGLKETREDPLIPATKAWIKKHTDIAKSPFLVHISDDLKNRFGSIELLESKEHQLSA